ncbi:MAG: Mut7-C RNAse domain-containing protein [Thermodesulfovibrionales bacterium]
MKLIADAMLGRLARWLRLLGFDTLYHRDMGDNELLRLARREGRTILTRDTHLLERCAAACVFVRSEDLDEQLAQVVSELGLRPSRPGRCANCNGSLRDVAEKAEVSGLVPDHVYLTHGRFTRCEGCGNVYWEGS